MQLAITVTIPVTLSEEVDLGDLQTALQLALTNAEARRMNQGTERFVLAGVQRVLGDQKREADPDSVVPVLSDGVQIGVTAQWYQDTLKALETVECKADLNNSTVTIS